MNLSALVAEASNATLHSGRGFLAEADEIVALAKQCLTTTMALQRWIQQNVRASDVLSQRPEEDVELHLADLWENVQRIQSLGADVIDALRDRPLDKLFRGFRLTSTEFHLLRASGVLEGTLTALSLSEIDEYEAFCMLQLEDERRCAYINPALGPDIRVKVGLKFGSAPEEVKLTDLRPEQHEFFASHLPHVLARFQHSSA